jgi:hypothetical protein
MNPLFNKIVLKTLPVRQQYAGEFAGALHRQKGKFSNRLPPLRLGQARPRQSKRDRP